MIKIALVGNPNCGKTTFFNALTGANAFVGNWPGVTVEKKEGCLIGKENIIITDLPGIYSLSPYTPEEIVARNYLLHENPDVILNIIDGTNLERNLYLSTQLLELEIPMVIAVNMTDILRKRGDKIDLKLLSKTLGAPCVEISALKNIGTNLCVELAIEASKNPAPHPKHDFCGPAEHALAHIEDAVLKGEKGDRWYAVKIFERDESVLKELKIEKAKFSLIEEKIKSCETELDDDSVGIIANERYNYIARVKDACFIKNTDFVANASENIDKVLTHRILALPIFAVIMFIVYYTSVTGVGGLMTDTVNDGIFGDGFFVGSGEKYEQALGTHLQSKICTSEFVGALDLINPEFSAASENLKTACNEGDFGAFSENFDALSGEISQISNENLKEQISLASANLEAEILPNPSEYGLYLRGLPVVMDEFLERINCAQWLKSLIIDGVISGVGAVLGFVPQMAVLFIFLAFLEACGYMTRVAFVLDRAFRKFGLSGKSFIPMLIGTGCGVPGVLATRTIESEKDRKMGIMTTTFMPCSAKMPMIALISAALFGGVWWVAPSAYFLGICAIVISGLMLKKTPMFAGKPAPFVLELPPYHMPTLKNIYRSVKERVSSFIKNAGTIIFISSVLIWCGSRFGFAEGGFVFDIELDLNDSFIGKIGAFVAPLFAPLGFGDAKSAIATLMGLVAKEEVVAVFGILDFSGLDTLSGYAFLAFNLLCAPCIAAMATIAKEMRNARWTVFALVYQTLFSYAVALMIYQFGRFFSGAQGVGVGLFVACACAALIILMLAKPYKEKI